MDPLHGYGQSLAPSFEKHAENYHGGGCQKFYLLWFNSITFLKNKRGGGKGTFKELTDLEIHQRWVFS